MFKKTVLIIKDKNNIIASKVHNENFHFYLGGAPYTDKSDYNTAQTILHKVYQIHVNIKDELEYAYLNSYLRNAEKGLGPIINYADIDLIIANGGKLDKVIYRENFNLTSPDYRIGNDTSLDYQLYREKEAKQELFEIEERKVETKISMLLLARQRGLPNVIEAKIAGFLDGDEKKHISHCLKKSSEACKFYQYTHAKIDQRSLYQIVKDWISNAYESLSNLISNRNASR
jgi:hypothetical protein